MGVEHVGVVYDEKEDVDFKPFPTRRFPSRAELNAVQEKFQTFKGVSAIVYIQTCAAEKAPAPQARAVS